MSIIRLALAQINPRMGDFSGNTSKILQFIDQARDTGANLIAFPELAVTGYPPEDLLLKPQFIAANMEALKQIISASKGITTVVGFINRATDIHNAAAVITNGELKGVYHKSYLPNYGVFDDYRYFKAGDAAQVFQLGDLLFGVNICEDIWYPGGPTHVQSLAGAQLIINISASPYFAGKGQDRMRMLATRAEDNAVALAYVNQVGGQDELVFDGDSLIFDEHGQIMARGKSFEEDLIIADINTEKVFRERLHDPRRRQERMASTSELRVSDPIVLSEVNPPVRAALVKPVVEPALSCAEEVYRALVLGTRDYVRKNGFERVVIGLSGGVDSALVACIAADALGPDQVRCVFMPTRYSSTESARDAKALAENLGVHYEVIEIEETFDQYLKMLAPAFDGSPMGIAEENIQARIRGNILMAISNKFGALVLSTGNKSETSVGYSTLYGDMCGGLMVIKDVPKLLVYELCNHLNSRSSKAVIPEYIITRPPSAELRDNQKDQDTLPPYEVLDAILEMYVEQDYSIDAMIAEGYDEKIVRWVVRTVDLNEYKRRQAAPGIKVTSRAFGRDRRMPITNVYRG